MNDRSPRAPLRAAFPVFLSTFTAGALAQAGAAPPATRLEPVVVIGNPLASREVTAPVSVLSGEALVLRRGSTLGETLDGLPGVSATRFGPNSSRPVIRGLDGERVRMLNNAGGSIDASSLSFDHAVPIDPLIVERVEVLRGPGALQYGGSAIGGVVNAIDNRIPKERLEAPTGSAELRLGGAGRERGGAAMVETGNGRFAIHADAFGRKTSNLQVPLFTPVEDGAPLAPTKRVRNSASDTRGGAFGGSLFFDRGYAGVSVDTYDSDYGTVAEPDISIRMKRDRIATAGEIKRLAGPFSTVRGQLSGTRYRHREVDGSGAVGTTFESSGGEARIEAEHRPIGRLKGVIGLQAEEVDFSALGAEAFVPSTRTGRQALFAVEELGWAGGTLTGGLRFERARIRSAGDADPTAPKFGAAAERRFSPRSASIANALPLSPQWTLTGSLGVTERAPAAFELFANGMHAATGTYERGDPALQVERGRNLDLGLQWKSGPNRLRVGGFASRYSRFISLQATGNTVDEAGAVVAAGTADSAPDYVFRAVRARLHGVEIDGVWRLLQGPTTLDLSGKLDLTRATNVTTGEPLPRIAPLRLAVGVDATHGPWRSRAEVDASARQRRVPATDVPTAGHAIVNLALTRKATVGGSDALWFVKLDNVTDKLARSAATLQSVRDLSPLPGRALLAGLRLGF